MADKNRGGRSVGDGDDTFDDDTFDGDTFDGDTFDGERDEFDGSDELEDLEDDTAPTKSGAKAASTAARARTVTRAKPKEVTAPGLLGKLIRFVREVIAELQKVIWPTRKELLTYTTVVVVFVSMVMTFVALLDVGFAKLMFLVFGSTTIEK